MNANSWETNQRRARSEKRRLRVESPPPPSQLTHTASLSIARRRRGTRPTLRRALWKKKERKKKKSATLFGLRSLYIHINDVFSSVPWFSLQWWLKTIRYVWTRVHRFWTIFYLADEWREITSRRSRFSHRTRPVTGSFAPSRRNENQHWPLI